MKVSRQELFDAEILIVDDQDVEVKLLERVLRDVGYRNVTSTTDPRQVSALHRDTRYDLILLDLLMPGMNGFQVMAALNVDHPDSYLPVIVFTDHSGHKVRALELGARDFISKPFDLVDARTRIHNMLEIRLLYKKLTRYNEELERAVAERTAELVDSEERYRRFTELASDWYWEQNEGGDFTQVSGPVEATLGLGVAAFLGASRDDAGLGWNDVQRRTLLATIAARQPFLDFAFTRVDAKGVTRQFRVSGEPMFDRDCRYVGFRGIGVEVLAKNGGFNPSMRLVA